MARQWQAVAPGAPETWRLAEIASRPPARSEVTITVRAAGVNPADYKHVATARAGLSYPVPIGYEVSGVLAAIGPDTAIASDAGDPGGRAVVGDDVLAFRVRGGYATEITVPAADVFRKPAALTHPEAANLLLAGTTAAEMLHVTDAKAGETILLHGASGAVGVSVIQLAVRRGVRVIGTASPHSFDRVRALGATPVAHGDGLLHRVREAAGDSAIAAALDAAGTDEALETSLALVADRSRIVTVVAAARAQDEHIRWIAGALPESARYRDAVRAELIDLAANGALVVPVSRTFALTDAAEALRFVRDGHPGGKVALIP